MSGIAIAATMEGMRVLMVEVQALVSTAVYGTPQRSSNGYDLRRLNMILAVLDKRCGFPLPQQGRVPQYRRGPARGRPCRRPGGGGRPAVVVPRPSHLRRCGLCRGGGAERRNTPGAEHRAAGGRSGQAGLRALPGIQVQPTGAATQGQDAPGAGEKVEELSKLLF